MLSYRRPLSVTHSCTQTQTSPQKGLKNNILCALHGALIKAFKQLHKINYKSNSPSFIHLFPEIVIYTSFSLNIISLSSHLILQILLLQIIWENGEKMLPLTRLRSHRLGSSRFGRSRLGWGSGLNFCKTNQA